MSPSVVPIMVGLSQWVVQVGSPVGSATHFRRVLGGDERLAALLGEGEAATLQSADLPIRQRRNTVILGLAVTARDGPRPRTHSDITGDDIRDALAVEQLFVGAERLGIYPAGGPFELEQVEYRPLIRQPAVEHPALLDRR
jgi:hypothetical protein